MFNSNPALYSLDVTDNEVDVGLKLFPSGALVEDVWSELSHIHSMRGLSPFGNEIRSIRFDLSNDKVVVTTKSGNMFPIKFQNATIFDLENVYNLPDVFKEEVTGYKVYDWFDVKSGMLHDLEEIEDNETNFVKKIKFFISTRIDGNKDKKDLVAESFLIKEQLIDNNYSDTMARFKTIDMMKGAGILGTKNGNNILPIKLELWKRDILPIKKASYIKHENIVYARE